MKDQRGRIMKYQTNPRKVAAKINLFNWLRYGKADSPCLLTISASIALIHTAFKAAFLSLKGKSLYFLSISLRFVLGSCNSLSKAYCLSLISLSRASLYAFFLRPSSVPQGLPHCGQIVLSASECFAPQSTQSTSPIESKYFETKF